jgi:protein-S-isoprenylcysteine O-methyltransferase Ste14
VRFKEQFWHFFARGPFGIILTVLIWFIVISIENLLKVPQMTIHPVLRTVLLSIFMVDTLYLLIGGNYHLMKSGRGKNIAKKGPYQFIRHPIYSVWIFSFTGIVAMVFYSWGIIISVIPISISWSWLVQREETEMLNKFGDEYKAYIEQTGQFLPSWRAMKDSAEGKG